MTPMTPLEGLQAALAGEHAAVHLLGLLGARTSQARERAAYDQLRAAYDDHRRRRDQLTVLVDQHGAPPVAAEVGYELPGPDSTAAERVATALLIEERTTTLLGQLVESTSTADRRWAIVALEASALRQLALGGTPRPVPGG